MDSVAPSVRSTRARFFFLLVSYMLLSHSSIFGSAQAPAPIKRISRREIVSKGICARRPSHQLDLYVETTSLWSSEPTKQFLA